MDKKRPLHIVFDAHAIAPNRSGIGEYSYHLCNTLASQFVENIRLSLYASGSITEVNSTNDVATVVQNVREGDYFRISHQLEFPRLLANDNYDLIHTPDFLAPVYKRGLPLIVTIHDLIPLVFSRQLKDSKKSRFLPLYKAVIALITSRAQKIITDSVFSKNDLLRYFKIEPEKIEVIPLASTLNRSYGDLPDDLALRLASKQYLLYVGRHDPYKGLANLLDAYRAFRKSEHNVPIKLVIAGKIDKRYSLTNFADQHDLANEVVFAGYRNAHELSALFEHALAFVLPSLYEGFGLPVLDAMNHEVPVLCSDKASLPEVAGNAAFFFDPENQLSIISALHAIISNDNLRSELISKGRQRAKEFSWNRTAKRTVEIYFESVKGRKAKK